MHTRLALLLPAPVPARTAASLADRSLVIRNLYKEYRAGVPVLKDVSLTVAGGGLTAIIGPSGTGKSTLVRCINRLVDPTAGEILFRGRRGARAATCGRRAAASSSQTGAAAHDAAVQMIDTSIVRVPHPTVVELLPICSCEPTVH